MTNTFQLATQLQHIVAAIAALQLDEESLHKRLELSNFPKEDQSIHARRQCAVLCLCESGNGPLLYNTHRSRYNIISQDTSMTLFLSMREQIRHEIHRMQQWRHSPDDLISTHSLRVIEDWRHAVACARQCMRVYV